MSGSSGSETAGKQAQLYVPRLLDALTGGAAAEAAFAAHWRGVPLEAFLPWGPSMLSLLEEPQGEALLPVLEVCSAKLIRASAISAASLEPACRGGPGPSLYDRRTGLWRIQH